MIAVVTAACVCSADIITTDLFEPGDQLLTADTVSGLEWLDLTQSAGLSFDAVTGGAGGWTDLGFSHATNSEIRDLFLQIEPLAPEPFDAFARQDAASRSLATQVNALLGPTGSVDTEEFTLGLSGTFAGVDQVAAPFVSVLDPADPDSEIVVNVFETDPVATDAADPASGHWLVRPLPEPSFELLRAASLVTLVTLAVERRRRAALGRAAADVG
jgi:hypothetical protein